jgi:shikimate O-hydroxycinnamoyltransferase
LKQATWPHHNENENTFGFTSWCKLPIYETDFGWGKPTWVTTSKSSRNTILLIDTKNGNGIEVIVNLEKNVMAKFEQEVELLQHASLNPSHVEHDA